MRKSIHKNRRKALILSGAALAAVSLTGCRLAPKLYTSTDIQERDSRESETAAETENEAKTPESSSDTDPDGDSPSRISGKDTVLHASSGSSPDTEDTEGVTESGAEYETKKEAETGTESAAETGSESERSRVFDTEQTSSVPDTDVRSAVRKAADLKRSLIRMRAIYGKQFTWAWQTAPAKIPILSWHSLAGRFLLEEYHPELPMPEKSMDMLKTSIENLTEGFSGTWSVYIRDLTTSRELILNDTSQPSASVMKLFVLSAVYQEIENGNLSYTDEIRSRMASMITASSNTDANALLSILGDGSYADGIARVNEYVRTHGYSDETHEYNGFQDSSTIIDPDHFNSIGAKDAGRLLSRVYHRTIASRSVCNQIEQWMLEQQTRYKIPAGIPDAPGVSVGNKTGETDSTENDAAVVYTPQGDYILVVLSNSWDSKSDAQEHIQEISSAVYSYFCGEDGRPAFMYIYGAQDTKQE